MPGQRDRRELHAGTGRVLRYFRDEAGHEDKTRTADPRASGFCVRLVTLDDEDIEAIADRVAAKLGGMPSTGWVGDVAACLGVDSDWVYRRWRALGGVKLGTAKDSPVRFDLARALELAAALSQPAAPDEPTRPRRGRPRKQATARGESVIRGTR
jgi:hypothetical protein